MPTARADAAARNQALEMQRNAERYAFLRWGGQAFANLRIVPPGNGICHQVNLEYLARVVWTERGGVAYPDSVLGMDSHTAMINSLGILGWGVGGLEGGAGALGESVAMLVPEVIGCRLVGKPQPGVTATDIVLTVTQTLRRHKVVDKFVEYFGPGVGELALPDRATISNMTPGERRDDGLLSGRRGNAALSAAHGPRRGAGRAGRSVLQGAGTVARCEYAAARVHAHVSRSIFRAVEPSVAGPSRPHDRVPLRDAPAAFRETGRQRREGKIKDGDVVIAAITSCTNTSNPAVMIGAGLLARNAVARGLKPRPWVKTSLSPGSRVVADYLEKSGLQASLDALGFQPAGYGCMTCMGNSGPLPPEVDEAIKAGRPDRRRGAIRQPQLRGPHASGGARRISSRRRRSWWLTRSPAACSSISTSEPLGEDRAGPSRCICASSGRSAARSTASSSRRSTPALYREHYADDRRGHAGMARARRGNGHDFRVERAQHVHPPAAVLRGHARRARRAARDIRGARVLGMFGDMFTTDHISPIGAISKGTPAAEYLASLGIAPRDFVNYAARRLNHDVMIRGTFASMRVRNEMTPEVEGSAPCTIPDGERMPIHAAAARYREEGVPLVVIAGAEYGAGSSRDWAAKGTRLLGVRAVIAESFERIHRSNLVGMGVLPLQFPAGVTRKTLGAQGRRGVRHRGHRSAWRRAAARVHDYARGRQARAPAPARAPRHQARGRLFPPRRAAALRGAAPAFKRGGRMNPRKEVARAARQAGYVVVPGAYDTLTARLVQVAGFEAVYLTGGGYSRANGYPDIGLITMSEVIAMDLAHGRRRRDPGDRRHGRRLRQRAQRDAQRARVREDRRRRRSTSRTRFRRRNAATTRASSSSRRPRWWARSRPRSTRAATPTW